MGATIAAALYGLLIVMLFVLDRDREQRPSAALWVPVIWMALGASRAVSQWFEGIEMPRATPDQYLEGNATDRNILLGLVALAAILLASRGRRAAITLKANWPILLFFFYGLLSVLWSDFPDVAFKRMIKGFGNAMMVMIVLTDPAPVAAIKRLFARVSFVLIPVSILLIKYFPQFGRGFSTMEWQAFNIGVTTDKNDLGAIAMIFGLASVWRFVEALRAGDGSRRNGPLVAHALLLAMTLYLFQLASSATSLVCFLLGTCLICALSVRALDRRPAAVHGVLIGAVFASLLVFFGASDVLFGALGRETTLTGRTGLWQSLMRIDIDPLFGTGFESFWLGDRAKLLWREYWWHPNQAHNGYLETYLNLGMLGVGLLLFVAAWGYRNVTRAIARGSEVGALRLALLVVTLVFNVTEASFKVMHPVWIAFLLAVAVGPECQPTDEAERAGDTPAMEVCAS